MKPLNKTERIYVAANVYAMRIPDWYHKEWHGRIWGNGQIILREDTMRHTELNEMAERIANNETE